MQDEVLTIGEACEALAIDGEPIHKATLSRYINAGLGEVKLRATRFGRRKFIRRSDLCDFMEQTGHPRAHDVSAAATG